MDYYAIVTTESLEHHGVKGMKWGVRKYQNYDGSYTQAGVKRFQKSLSEYEKQNQRYKNTKNNRKMAPDIVSKSDVVNAKIARNSAKRKLNKDYNHLKLDKKADKGKERYANGERITMNKTVSSIMKTVGSLSVSAAAYGYNRGVIDKKTAAALAVVGGTALVGSAGYDVIKSRANNQLRAYYAHTSNY